MLALNTFAPFQIENLEVHVANSLRYLNALACYQSFVCIYLRAVGARSNVAGRQSTTHS